MRQDINKIDVKIDETNKTLSLILAKLINPNVVQPDGFAVPSTITRSTGVAPAVTQSAGVANSINTIQSSANSVILPAVVMQSTANSVPLSPAMVVQSTNSTNAIQSIANSVPLSPAVVQSTNSTSAIQSSANSVSVSPAIVVQSTNSTNAIQSIANSVPLSPTVVQSTSAIQSSPNSMSISPAVVQSTNSDNVTLLAHPTPDSVHFETVTTSSPQDTTQSGILEQERINSIRQGCCSRRNFAAKLVVALFNEDTRRRSNVGGKLGKLKLNPVLIQYVRSLAFQYYPPEHHESEKAAWAKCVISIDEVNRRLNKPVKSV